MIHLRGEPLFPTGVNRIRISAANIAPNDSTGSSQLSQSPNKIHHRKSAIFPVGHGLVCAKAIKINRHINVCAATIVHEALEVFAPVVVQDCTTPFTIFRRPIVRPRMHFQYSFAFGAATPKDLPRPPAFKISTAPDRDMLDLWQFHRAVQPPAATPLRRSHIPVRVIIKRDKDEWLLHPSHPKRAQMMEITRTEE